MSHSPISKEAAAFLQHERVGFTRDEPKLESPFAGYTQSAPGFFMRSDLVLHSDARIQAQYAAQWLRLGFVSLLEEVENKVDLQSEDGSRVSATNHGFEHRTWAGWPSRPMERNIYGTSLKIGYNPSLNTPFGKNGNEYHIEVDKETGIYWYYSYKKWPPYEGNKYGYSRAYIDMDDSGRLDFNKAVLHLARTITQYRLISPDTGSQ